MPDFPTKVALIPLSRSVVKDECGALIAIVSMLVEKLGGDVSYTLHDIGQLLDSRKELVHDHSTLPDIRLTLRTPAPRAPKGE